VEISGGREAEPHAFPWIVRMFKPSKNRPDKLFGSCGGTLITSRHVLTAFHCVDEKENECAARDFSKGDHYVVVGRNSLKTVLEMKDESLYKIPIIDVKHPKHAGLSDSCNKSVESHDFAMLVLQEPVVFSATVSPICLPSPGEGHYGQPVVAAGWGMFTTDNKQDRWTGQQSKLLKRVNLRVSQTRYKHKKMFGTEVEFKRGNWQDPCAGDSGGPLIYQTPGSGRWVIIGTVYGAGFDCRTGQVQSSLEGHKEGIWNKVSAHSGWILEQLQGDKNENQ